MHGKRSAFPNPDPFATCFRFHAGLIKRNLWCIQELLFPAHVPTPHPGLPNLLQFLATSSHRTPIPFSTTTNCKQFLEHISQFMPSYSVGSSSALLLSCKNWHQQASPRGKCEEEFIKPSQKLPETSSYLFSVHTFHIQYISLAL